MSISALYMLNLLGKPLIYKNYQDTHEPGIIEEFMPALMDQEEEGTLTPVLEVNGTTFAYVKYNNVYIISTSSRNANIMLVFVFLHKIAQVMKDYFTEIEEESIRDNFVILYELLDEIMDFGYPQITESSILKEYITQESKKLESRRTIPQAVTNAVSWRAEGIRYKKNELFLDVVEAVDLLAKCNGSVIKSEIKGSVRIKSNLSGMPELRLGLNDRLLCEKEVSDSGTYVNLDEVKFHQCVRLSNFEDDHSITFIPPDGEFELMSYRISAYLKPPLWVDCFSKVCPNHKIEYTIKVTSYFKSKLFASFVHIEIPVPYDVDSPKYQATVGSVKYLPERNILMWSIKNFSGWKEFYMTANFRLPVVPNIEERETTRPIQVIFEIPQHNISGMQVQYLKVLEKSGYQSLPWVRYVTKNGDYQIRQRESVFYTFLND